MVDNGTARTGSADQASRPTRGRTCQRSRRSGSLSGPAMAMKGQAWLAGRLRVAIGRTAPCQAAVRSRCLARQRGTPDSAGPGWLPPGRHHASRRPGLGPAPRILAVSVLGVPAVACGPPPAPKREASRTCLPGPGDYRLHPRRLFLFSKVSPAQQQDKVVEVPQPHRCTQSNRLDFM